MNAKSILIVPLLLALVISHYTWRNGSFFVLQIFNDENVGQSEKVKDSVTVVSAYFTTSSPSKHTGAQYDKWLANFLPSIDAPLILILGNYSESAVLRHRGNRTTHIQHLVNAWALPHAEKLKSVYEGTQRDLDPEKQIHIPELYAIWNAKAALLANAVRGNLYGSQYYLWVDAGSFRTRSYFGWPDRRRVEQVMEASNKKKRYDFWIDRATRQAARRNNCLAEFQ